MFMTLTPPCVSTGFPKESADVLWTCKLAGNRSYLIKQVMWLCIWHYVLLSFVLSLAHLLTCLNIPLLSQL